MDPTDPFQASAGATTFGSRNAAFGAGRSGALHSVAGVAANTKRAGFATGGANRMGSLAPTRVSGGIGGISASQRANAWGTGHGGRAGSLNGIGASTAGQFAQMLQNE